MNNSIALECILDELNLVPSNVQDHCISSPNGDEQKIAKKGPSTLKLMETRRNHLTR